MKKSFLSISCLLMAGLTMAAAFLISAAPYSALFSGLTIMLLCFSLKCKAEESPAEAKSVSRELS
jgi:uncharacterized membrane protein